jgi:hypothetical protein
MQFLKSNNICLDVGCSVWLSGKDMHVNVFENRVLKAAFWTDREEHIRNTVRTK